ncbi:MAG: 2-oxoacid:acceptor oxidoreductase family protein, partial [Oscillospiraceae bacterium]|nr:2-oxoacid:acceptor oxidoreductase family protein [Oscillospiraceae bacterium]
LGELGAIYLGLNSASFSSYGSEKRGSPVKAYVRWCDACREILHNSPVERPQLLALFHEALADTLPVTAGVKEDSIIVVDSHKSADELRDRLKLQAGTLCVVDALELALQSKSRLNMVMLGAICRASDFIPLDAAKELVAATLGKKYPAMLENNLTGLKLGYEELQIKYFSPDGKYDYIPYQESRANWGYENAPIGGINPHFGSTAANDLSASREGYIPLFLPEKCIHCGLCDSTCPDMVFQFTPGEFKGKAAMMNRGLDYHHCKGCLRCVDVCPTGALVSGKEHEHPLKQHFVRNKDLIAEHIDFVSAGAAPWVTGASYLDEKRVDGGLM